MDHISDWHALAQTINAPIRRFNTIFGTTKAPASPLSTVGILKLVADREYHFLIRVWDSAETFHLQVTARNRSVALKQARMIPNLIDCRAISSEELARIVKKLQE
jgi:hypothetical protein